MGQWINSDGLVVRLGNTEAEITRGGWFGEGATGENLICEFVIDLANVPLASAILEDTQDIVFPGGFIPFEVRIVTEVAATGAGSVLNLGFNRQDRTTVYDATGLLAAAPRTDWATVGSSFTYKVGVTGVGTKIGVPLSNAGDTAHGGLVLVADYDTTVFSAGRIRVQVVGQMPRPSPSNA